MVTSNTLPLVCYCKLDGVNSTWRGVNNEAARSQGRGEERGRGGRWQAVSSRLDWRKISRKKLAARTPARKLGRYLRSLEDRRVKPLNVDYAFHHFPRPGSRLSREVDESWKHRRAKTSSSSSYALPTTKFRASRPHRCRTSRERVANKR